MGQVRLRKPAEDAIRGRHKLHLLFVCAEAGTSILLDFAGRCLVALLVTSIITMPLTQRLWGWDHFLRGGQDFEFGALGILLFLSLALVLSRNLKQAIELLFSRQRLTGIRLPKENGICRVLAGTPWTLYTGSAPDSTFCVSGLPLRI